MRIEQEKKTMVNDLSVKGPAVNDFQFDFTTATTQPAETKPERHPEDEPTIEMTRAELDEMQRKSAA
jgi:hypothetical protein